MQKKDQNIDNFRIQSFRNNMDRKLPLQLIVGVSLRNSLLTSTRLSLSRFKESAMPLSDSFPLLCNGRFPHNVCVGREVTRLRDLQVSPPES